MIVQRTDSIILQVSIHGILFPELHRARPICPFPQPAHSRWPDHSGWQIIKPPPRAVASFSNPPAHPSTPLPRPGQAQSKKHPKKRVLFISLSVQSVIYLARSIISLCCNNPPPGISVLQIWTESAYPEYPSSCR